MNIVAVGKALPPHLCTQEEAIDRLAHLWADRPTLVARLRQLQTSSRVATRYLALPKERYLQLNSFTEANAAYLSVGTELATTALTEALAAAGLAAKDLDALFFTTVTGVAVPTIDAHLVNRLSLRRDLKRIPLFGLGCVAGVAGTARMYDYLKAYPDHCAALVAVELCSLTLQHSDRSMANMIASGLFGDGSAAMVGFGEARALPAKAPSLRVQRTRSAFYYNTEGVMGWEIGSNGFKVVLDASVPTVVRDRLSKDVADFLAEEGRSSSDVGSWICHPGGPKVLTAIEETFKLGPEALRVTWDSLRDVGNLSSASVLFVLAETLAQHRRPAGTQALMLAMGPGFCAELVDLVWGESP